MKYFIIILLTSNLLANIKNISANYDISYGIFGKMGKVHANINTDINNNYKIKVIAYATGISAILSNDMKEIYTSIGIYINGRYKPNTFIKIKSTNDQIKKSIYTFNYKKKKVYLNTINKYKVFKHSFDNDTFNDDDFNDDFTWEIKKSNKILDYYNDEDILSLFFNIKSYIKTFQQGKTKHIVAIGSSDTRKGKIDLIIPKGEKHNELSNILNSKDDILIVKIYTNIFSSNNGELFLKLNQQGIASKAILKDVLFFGDIVANIK